MSLWRTRRKRRWFLTYTALVVVLIFILPWGIYTLLEGDGSVNIPGDNIRIKLLNHENGNILELGLEEYLVGVVAAEMPASFPAEALKAQAIAARTYAVKRIQVPDPRAGNGEAVANLSSDPAVNQAWISDEVMRERWGKWNYTGNKNRIIEAVKETKDIVIIHNGQLIDPAYHASCGGVGTENSGNVWKYDIPYLKHVACNNHPAANHDEVKVFSLQDFCQALNIQTIPTAKSLNSKGGLEVKEKTISGRIRSLSFAGKLFTGTELRSILGLKSTHMEIRPENSIIKVITKGYGHGVGMCQHGAGAMAKEGKSHKEILTYYYTGVSLTKIRKGN